MVLTYWSWDDLLLSTHRIRHITAFLCEIGGMGGVGRYSEL